MADTEPHAWETGRMNSITYVGLDVHKATVSVAVAEGGRGGEVRQLGVFENRPEVLSKLAARLRVRPGTLTGIAEFSEHETDGSELEEGEPGAVEVLPVLG